MCLRCVSGAPAMPRFLQPYETIALSLIFEVMGECRYNRTPTEYMAIAAQLAAHFGEVQIVPGRQIH
jgi:hypothetical protein